MHKPINAEMLEQVAAMRMNMERLATKLKSLEVRLSAIETEIFRLKTRGVDE